MKGLWVKDLLLLQKQFKTFLIFMVIAAFNAYTIKSVPVIFIFMTFFFVTTAASTIFYDQENHGFLYLFTLPTRKKDYVIQKQLLILASSLVAVVASLILILLMMQFDRELQVGVQELLYTALSGFFFGCLYGAIITPLYLRYGTEKARMLLFAIMGIFALVWDSDPKDGSTRGNNGFRLYSQRGSLQFAANNRLDPRADWRGDGAFNICQPTVY